MTAPCAITAEIPLRPNGAGGETEENSEKRSGLAQAVDHAGRVEARGHLVDQLLDVERDLDPLLDIAGIGAGF